MALQHDRLPKPRLRYATEEPGKVPDATAIRTRWVWMRTTSRKTAKTLLHTSEASASAIARTQTTGKHLNATSRQATRKKAPSHSPDPARASSPPQFHHHPGPSFVGRWGPGKAQSYGISGEDVTVLDDSNKPSETLGLADGRKFAFAATKTDQLREGTSRTPCRSEPGWCRPVQIAWFHTKHHEMTGTPANILLCLVSENDKLHVSHVAGALKCVAASVGEDPARIGSTTLRSGGATAMISAGVDSLTVKKFGRWKSAAVERYTVLKDDLTASLACSMLGKCAQQRSNRATATPLPGSESQLIIVTVAPQWGRSPEQLNETPTRGQREPRWPIGPLHR
ncbi:hypothetical protein ON010_g13342 [Phytophthora cinnamomi]|nr:hypothetical protein ON010_g13342 [Phytophthora cinnamomi]